MHPNHDQLMLDLYASSVNPSYGLHVDDSFDDTMLETNREVWECMHTDIFSVENENGGT